MGNFWRRSDVIIQALIAGYAAAASGGPPITSGLIFRLDAGTLSAADGAAVTSWADISGLVTVTSLTGSGPIMRATGINGARGVDFSNGSYFNAALSFSGAVGGTILAVMKNATSGDAPNCLAFGPGGGANTCYVPFSGTDLYDANLSSARAGPVTLATPAMLQSPFIYTVYSSAAGGKIRLNRADVLTNSNAYLAPPDYGLGQKIGQSGGDNRPAPQVLAELLVYNRTLTSGEITSSESYLSTKWGTP